MTDRRGRVQPRSLRLPVLGVQMATDIVAQLADSLAQTGVEEGELSYKGQGRKLNDAQSVEEIRCYWSDMFTGRLRSEIPPALNSLGDALMLAGARLTVLDLSDNAFGPDGVKGIEKLLKSTACYTLQELRLNNCGMGIGGGKILAASLIQCHKKSSAESTPLSLRVFVAGRNRLENDGATALAQAFQPGGGSHAQNGINHPGVTALATAVQHNLGLRILNLNDNTFTEKGAIAMARYGDICIITVIKQRNNRSGSETPPQYPGDKLWRLSGAASRSQSYSRSCVRRTPILKELNLSFGEITEDAALAVAQAVKDKDQLQKLDLNGNCLGEDGCKALKDALEGMNMGELLGSLSCPPQHQQLGHQMSPPSSAFHPPTNCSNWEQESFADRAAGKHRDDCHKCSHTSSLTPSCVCEVDVTDAMKTAEAFLKIASVYKEENTDVKDAVLDSIDALLKKAFASPSFQGYSFVSSLLVLLGLIKSEDKVKPVLVVPGHLQALEHIVRQDYFPKRAWPCLRPSCPGKDVTE
ncbi:hypothetical protein INR49_028881 [Caranx melampygus]|nr:hypothetical protein INR49_028881 [Caranx melampygus]